MRRTFSQVVASLVVIALVAPAASAAAQDAARPISSTTSVMAPVSINTAITRAVTANQAANQGPIAPKVKARGIRMQGGGKGAMISGIIYTVVGLAGTVYMIKYMKDMQKKNETEPLRIR
jgi:hypothetical protein